MSSIVLITGASTGFGRAGAELLARRGHRVFATMRNIASRNATHRQALEGLAAADNLPLEVLDLDVTDDRSVQVAVEEALKRAGRIDVVINNAGIAAVGVTEAYTPQQFEGLFDVNVLGPVRVNRAVLPSMRAQGRGLLIHVSSGAGRLVVPAMAAYCASKFALEALADAYRFELRPFGIDSVLIEPGIYRTPIFDSAMPPADRERLDQYGARGKYADRVFAVFRSAIGDPANPGAAEVAQAFANLIEMPAADRPLRTIVSSRIQPLLESYNQTANSLRQVVAQIFSLEELLLPPGPKAASD
jgi:NAD(P)-dependent dehydrogenase (short-subunit alcohol dehydrogenase family)